MGSRQLTVVRTGAAPAGSPPGRLLLVTPTHQLARRGAELGFRVWSLWDAARVEADFAPRIAEVSEELLLTDFADEARLRRAVARAVRRHGIDAVLHCGHGGSLLPVAEEAWRLGVAANPPEVYRRLAACAPAPARAVRLSAETLTVDGRHHVVGLTAQRTSGPPHFHVTGYLHPAPLADHQRRAVEAAVVAWLTAGGYRSGPAHTEVALLPDGPRIVSCAPHLGAGRIPLLVEIASGFDIEAAVFTALRGSHPVVPSASRYAELGFFLLPEGRLETYTGTEDIAVSPWVRGARFPYRRGDSIPPPGDPRGRRGYVVVEGETPEVTQERIAQARQDLVADIRPARPPGP